METALLAIGAALLGLVVVALAFIWAKQEREFVQTLRQALKDCEETRDDDRLMMLNAHERVHKAQSEIAEIYTMNSILTDKVNALSSENDALKKQLAVARAAVLEQERKNHDRM